jgi:hypothetical protein
MTAPGQTRIWRLLPRVAVPGIAAAMLAFASAASVSVTPTVTPS